MGKIIKRPEEYFPVITQQLHSALGVDLQSILLYGSAASGAYVAGRSDINFLVLVTEPGMNKLENLHPLVDDWRKYRVALPLVMTRKFLMAALDVYPIEFLTMQAQHTCIYGEDVLSSLNFDRICLRLQVEREAKGKLIHLWQGYLDAQGQVIKLRDLIKVSLVAILSLFSAVLYLGGKFVPAERRQVIHDACLLTGNDAAVFQRCLEIREEAVKYDLKEMGDLFDRYLAEIVKFDLFVDRLN